MMSNLKTYIVRGYEHPNTPKRMKFSEMVRAPSGSQAKKMILERYERRSTKIPVWVLSTKMVDDGSST